jgi:cytochrome c oxidase subunit 3
MATTTPPPIEELPRPKRQETDHTSNGGGWKNLIPADRNPPLAVDQFSPPPSSSAIWVGIAAICMSFAAFTSALIVRQGASSDWRHLTLPPVLFFSTFVLLLSSGTLEIARQRVAVYMAAGARPAHEPQRWLLLTMGLGLLFVAGQYMAWLQLRSEGLYLATNVNSSFFYVLTAMHALHVLVGLAALLRVIVKVNRFTLRRSTLNAMACYWHFMGVLWVYLFVLLWLRL